VTRLSIGLSEMFMHVYLRHGTYFSELGNPNLVYIMTNTNRSYIETFTIKFCIDIKRKKYRYQAIKQKEQNSKSKRQDYHMN